MNGNTFEYEYPHVHRAREARRARTVRVERLPRSMRPPEERAARANALARATRNARRSVYATLSAMNEAPMLTRPTNKVRLSRYAENAITALELFPTAIVIEVRNKANGNKKYMTPNTFKQFFRNGVYISPYSRNPGLFRVLKATYGKNNKKENNSNVLKRGMEISKTIEKNRRKYERVGKLIPRRLVGMPNTRGNAAFARSLA